jgi:GGDEF domain-containing protein
MAVCYSDINNFKPFNDVYGFSHGDEVLRMLARVIFNAVKESGGGFVGHIGGDDFVFIVPEATAEEVAQTVIRNFDIIASDLFGEEERRQGYYVAKNRKGEEERIPLMGLAIAIVPLGTPKIQHYGKVAEIAAELKKVAKKSDKSCYYVDMRT